VKGSCSDVTSDSGLKLSTNFLLAMLGTAVCVHVFMHAHTYIYIGAFVNVISNSAIATCTRALIFSYMCTHMYVYIHVYMCIHIYKHIYICNTYTYVHTYVHIYIYTCIFLNE